MPFMTYLDVRAYRPGEFALLTPFPFQFLLNGVFFQLTVPRRFITDFASIPWIVQALPGFDVNGSSRYAAVAHDFLYCCQGKVEVDILDGLMGGSLRKSVARFSRAQCDDIFRQAILDIGRDKASKHQISSPYSEFQADLFWAGVRAGGWYYWRKRKTGPGPEDFASASEMAMMERDG
jgi:hypothetical protein